MTREKVDDLLKRGGRLYADGNTTGAARLYAQALRLAPDDPTVRLRHATAIWHGEDRAEEALTEVRALAQAYPQAVVLATEALILSALGRFTEAATAARRALRADPEHSSAWLDLAGATPAVAAYPLIDELRAELQVPDGTPKRRRDLHFALAMMLRKAGEDAAAFTETVRANNLTPQRWNAKQEAAFQDQLRQTFTPGLMAAHEGQSDLGAEMIFVVGMPRSGTTLTERLVLSHPQVGSVGESKAIGNLFNQLRHACQRSPDAVREALKLQMLGQIGRAYLQAMHSRVRGTPDRIIDKMPANTLFLPFIRDC